MQYTLYPTKDSTIYEQYPHMNAGLDPSLDLIKTVISSASVDTVLNSRIVMQFDTDLIESLISSSTVSSGSTYTLELTPNTYSNLPEAFDINVHALTITSASVISSDSWNMGLGLKQYYPSQSSGITWASKGVSRYTVDNTLWNTGSFVATTTGSWQTIPGGGNWLTSVNYSQSFEYEVDNISILLAIQ